MGRTFFLVLGFFTLLRGTLGIGQMTCVLFQPSTNSFPIVNDKKAAPILISANEWPGVQLAAADFAADILRVTDVEPSITNISSPLKISIFSKTSSPPIIVGTLGKSSLIKQVIDSTGLDVSAIQGNWESFMSRVVYNPLPGIDSAYVIIGADKRGTIFALYDHSEQFGVSPWYWWADVPTTKHTDLFVASSGCSHGSPSVKYRGIFLNDEQPALQNWATKRFTNGTGAALTGSPFNHFFYIKIFELMLRIKANYLWPAMWSSAFAVDDSENQLLADYYGVVMGTSHQEPMMRSTPNEFSLFGKGSWDYTINAANINQFWLEGTERARPFESVYTLGMRGFGDLPLSETTDISLLENVIGNQTLILQTVYNITDVSVIPQIWTLYKEVEGYYEDGMRVPDYVTLLWTDDNWGNVRRFPTISERNRTGGAGVYYHLDLVGGPRNYKWITSSQIEKIYEQMSIAINRQADRLWILNVGDLKPYEREIEFFISYGWNATRWSVDNLSSFVTQWAQREFGLTVSMAGMVTGIVANLTRFNSRRRPELLNSTTYSLINYREAENVLAEWAKLEVSSTAIYNSLSSAAKPAFFQLVHHPVIASNNLAKLLITAGMNNLGASQAFLSTNQLADTVEELFENDYNIEKQYHTLLNGKWDHMMDQTHIGYYYWQQPMTNTMPMITRVQSKKEALAGVMRIAPEGTLGAWPGDNPNQCTQGYNCPFPTITSDNFSPIQDRYIDVGAGGPTPFTFTVLSNVTWLKVSASQGFISPNDPEQRVFVSVPDWSQLNEGENGAVVTFTATATATASDQPALAVPVFFIATKNTPSSGFKGFVEGTGVISIEAAHASRKTSVNGISWTEIPGYGRTVSGLTPMPRNDATFSAGAGPSLEYDFFNFNTFQGTNDSMINVILYLSPSLNANTEAQPLAYSIQVDSKTPITVVPVGPEVPGGLPDGWDGWVANSVTTVSTTFKGIFRGNHTLKIFMMQPALVIQKIVIDTSGLRSSYLGPPESILV